MFLRKKHLKQKQQFREPSNDEGTWTVMALQGIPKGMKHLCHVLSGEIHIRMLHGSEWCRFWFQKIIHMFTCGALVLAWVLHQVSPRKCPRHIGDALRTICSDPFAEILYLNAPNEMKRIFGINGVNWSVLNILRPWFWRRQNPRFHNCHLCILCVSIAATGKQKQLPPKMPWA